MASFLSCEYLQQHADSSDLCTRLQNLAQCDSETADAKIYLIMLKQVLQTKPLPDIHNLLIVLVPIYIRLDNKHAAKKVLSSFFQSLSSPHQIRVQELLCQEMKTACEKIPADSGSQTAVRKVVDLLAALMDNFPIGEECITHISSTAVEFLSKAQDFFLNLFRMPGQSAVMLNSVMHDCHVTMQVLNKLVQRHIAKDADLLQKLNMYVLTCLLRNNIVVMHEEQMMVDCRCCCAINLVLLLQLLQSEHMPQIVQMILHPQTSHPALPKWFQQTGLEKLRMNTLSPMTSLALMWGLLSMLSSEVITMETFTMEMVAKETSLVCEVLLRELMSLDGKCQTTTSRVQCMKTVTLWTTRMRSVLEENGVAETVQARFLGQGSAITQLLHFVWTHWQDQLDVVRQNSRLIFDASLKLHILASQCADPSSDKFLLSVLERVLEVSWSNHSKFGSLISLVHHLGSRPLLASQSNFPTTLLSQMQDQGVACHASELYETLVRYDKQLPSETGDADRNVAWLQVWVNPIIAALCGGTRKLKQHVIEYILPKVMKSDKAVLEYILSRLASSEKTAKRNSSHLGALIVCLRRARAWGLMSQSLHMQDSSADVWVSIRKALSSPEEQVRLDAFALLCENKRTSEPVTQVEFDHLRHFITYNLNNQSPAFRQAMLSFFKKLFLRINESQAALLRQKKKGQKVEEALSSLTAYQDFLSWLEEFLFCQLYPFSAFARRTMSLAILSSMLQDIHADKDGKGFHPLAAVTINHIQTLLECLTDTFEENKQEAYALLIAANKLNRNILTEEHCKALYSAALKLAVSTRPQDCGTAAYLLRFLSHLSCLSSIIETDAAGETWLTNVSDMPVKVHLLRTLLLSLMDQLSVARNSLVVAAANRPMYPTLHCIRYILEEVNFRSVDSTHRALWNEFFSRLLQVCLQVAEVVSPVVQNSSPEGNVPEEAVLGPGLKFDLGMMAEVEESRQTVTLMPEYLVVCCWRSIKEVSLLLGQICQHVPITRPGVSEGMISFQQIEEMGSYFKQQLMESLHRGAFELAYAGFVMMCQMLWKSSWHQLQTLPQHWLQEVMAAITATDTPSQLCATRRSAGVPFFVQAIVATETSVSGRPSFHQAIKQLLDIALSSTTAVAISTDAQVHALNILRALFRDTRLGDDVAPYISDGMMAAVLGFKSNFWEVRNSSTLLMSALMTRVFGVKRTKDDTILCKRNSQTGRAFFHKYPALYQFLLSELDQATQNLGSSGHLHLHPSLYPVLMVLGRLFPSTMEGSSTRLNLAAFIPYVIRCSSSPVYKTRMMAARALQPLAGKDQVTEVLTTLLEKLPPNPQSDSTPVSQSFVHGILLQIHHLLMLTPDLSVTLLQKLAAVCAAGWSQHMWLLSRDNHCVLTRKVALDVTDLILTSTASVSSSQSLDDQRIIQDISDNFITILQTEVSFSTHCYNPHTPFLSEFLSCVAALALKHLVFKNYSEERVDKMKKIVLALLNFNAYEVHLTVLDTLDNALRTSHVCSGSLELDEKHDNGADENDDESQMSPPTSTDVDVGDVRPSPESGGVGDNGDMTVGPSLLNVVPMLMTKAIVDQLLAMGLRKDGHAETVVKVFQVLSCLPSIDHCTEDGTEIFEQLVHFLQKEKRADVKAAMILFSSHLFPGIYGSLQKPSSDKSLAVLREWTQVLQACCVTEQSEVLQQSCACVVHDNTTTLLIDNEKLLGPLVFEFWGILVTLLQADDLEVKDIASSVCATLSPSVTGGTHPDEALMQTLQLLFSLHGGTCKNQCVLMALQWLQNQEDEDKEDSSERLFDKGEMNTFRDNVALTKLIAQVLKTVALSKEEQMQIHHQTNKAEHNSSSSTTKVEAKGDDTNMVNVEKDFAKEISDLILSMEADVLRTAEQGVSGVFVEMPRYCDDVQLLIRVAVVAANLKDISADSRVLAAYQKLELTLKTVLGKVPVSGLLLRKLMDAL